MPIDPQATFASAAVASKEMAGKAIKPSPGRPLPPGKEEPNAVRRKPGSKSKVWIYVVAPAVLAAGIISWLFLAAGKSDGGAAVESTLPLDTFVVNLDGSGQRAYLRVGITLGLSRPLARNNKEDVPIAILRDTVLAVLAGAKPEDLLTAEGKQTLKADLLRALSGRVPQMNIQNVYFTEFLVQM